MMDYHHQLMNKNGLKTTSYRGGHFLFIINKAGNLVRFRRGLRVVPPARIELAIDPYHGSVIPLN